MWIKYKVEGELEQLIKQQSEDECRTCSQQALYVLKNYYKNNDVNSEILVKWRSHAYLLFSNWLNYYVYQSTPYNLDDLEKMKTPR